jgi:branched-chain amino acid transport system substrate-binding protein
MRRPLVRSLGLITAVATVGLVGYGKSAPASTGAGTAAASGSTSAAKTLRIPKASTDWALRYTGGKAGKADSSKTPVRALYINQQGGTTSFDFMTPVAQAAVRYINESLGGIKGHPLNLSSCSIQTEEDGQKCGAQLLNNKSTQAGVVGLMSTGNQSLYATVQAKKPLIVSFAITGPDLTAKKGVYSYTSSAASAGSVMALTVAE